MNLKELIDILEKSPQYLVVPRGFGSPHSWRGIYSELAFEPEENVSVAHMLEAAKSAVGTTYEGYKGGDFTVTESTEVHVEEYGMGKDLIGEMFMWYMLRNA
jgi:hypothetical protein